MRVNWEVKDKVNGSFDFVTDKILVNLGLDLLEKLVAFMKLNPDDFPVDIDHALGEAEMEINTNNGEKYFSLFVPLVEATEKKDWGEIRIHGGTNYLKEWFFYAHVVLFQSDFTKLLIEVEKPGDLIESVIRHLTKTLDNATYRFIKEKYLEKANA